MLPNPKAPTPLSAEAVRRKRKLAWLGRASLAAAFLAAVAAAVLLLRSTTPAGELDSADVARVLGGALLLGILLFFVDDEFIAEKLWQFDPLDDIEAKQMLKLCTGSSAGRAFRLTVVAEGREFVRHDLIALSNWDKEGPSRELHGVAA
ncbi:hypothetical protein F6X40_27540 [Paraburkholderia sp. UCT31]|uniref:hypothetical protein n=1 Tax=Paraburkholderia sp. UCT31 TaxID=2615209 RepID=UPI0016563C82|nr:hypothetical protein [Paraburkholderia sp. UCT31]MBC8740414.1 hypothetical protein [Paraburkholderia sp. UCT31]